MVKLQNILNVFNIWSHNENSAAVLTSSSEAASVWIKCCQTLTQKYWPNHSLHVWEGSPYDPQPLKKFHGRLKEVRKFEFNNTILLVINTNTIVFTR